MKKYTLNYIFGTFFLLTGLILIFSNDISDKISAIISIMISIIIYPIFDSICSILNVKFSFENRLLLLLATIIFPSIVISDNNSLRYYDLIVSVMIILMVWSFMFSSNKIKHSKTNNEEQLFVETKSEKDSSNEEIPFVEEKDKNDINNEEQPFIDEKNKEDIRVDHECSSNMKNVDKTLPVEYSLPSFKLLYHKRKTNELTINDSYIPKKIENTLLSFGIKAMVNGVKLGPRFDVYETLIIGGTRISEVECLIRELSMGICATVYDIKPSNYKSNTLDIILYKKHVETLQLTDVLKPQLKKLKKDKLLVAIGKNVFNDDVILNICKLPNLIISGAVGSGVSTCMNTIFLSILMLYKPDEVNLLIVDTKNDFINYNKLPHLILPVFKDVTEVIKCFDKITKEIENRHRIFVQNDVKNITAYNELANKDNNIKKLPYIIVLITDLTDLMIFSKNMETFICQIAERSNIYGIYMIIGVVTPSSKIITDNIKEYIPARIALAVRSKIESRAILDENGAENLGVDGDLLYKLKDGDDVIRCQGCDVKNTEIERVYNRWIEQANFSENGHLDVSNISYNDPLYDEAVDFVISTGKASASLLQRRFKIGYNRAERIVRLLEERKIIGPPNGSNPREILVKPEHKS